MCFFRRDSCPDCRQQVTAVFQLERVRFVKVKKMHSIPSKSGTWDVYQQQQ